MVPGMWFNIQDNTRPMYIKFKYYNNYKIRPRYKTTQYTLRRRSRSKIKL